MENLDNHSQENCIRGRSKTTWTQFWTFLTPLPPAGPWWTVLLKSTYVFDNVDILPIPLTPCF